MPLRRRGSRDSSSRRSSSTTTTIAGARHRRPLPLLALSRCLLLRFMFALLVLRPSSLVSPTAAFVVTATATACRSSSRSRLAPTAAFALRTLSMSSSNGGAADAGAKKLRIVTYNILTPHYATPRDLPLHPPVHLEEKPRLEKVLAKLKTETAQGSVIALQEVSRGWAGHLHAFFARAGYHFVHSGYSRPASGYMGVGLAWPTAALEAVSVEISRLADAKPWPAPPPPGALAQLRAALAKPFRRLLSRGSGRRSDVDVMGAAKDRPNTVIIAHLRRKTQGQDAFPSPDSSSSSSFFVACYHMPCEFRRPPIMTVHAALLAQRVQALAGGPNGGTPHIVTGDFNFQPSGPQYKLLTEGSIPPTDPQYPALPPTDSWVPRVDQPLRSALAAKFGREPEFTCHSYADRESGERFCEPLDYIFLSPHWRVLDAVALPDKAAALAQPCPFPNEEEPSDHVLLWAELGL